MIANNLQTIQVGRRNPDYPGVIAGNTLQTYQGVLGFQGSVFGGWKWDFASTTGSARVKAAQLTNPRVADRQHAAYAVRNSLGQIVCGPLATDPTSLRPERPPAAPPWPRRSTAAALPFNVFGAGRQFGGGELLHQRRAPAHRHQPADRLGQPVGRAAVAAGRSRVAGRSWPSGARTTLTAVGCPTAWPAS